MPFLIPSDSEADIEQISLPPFPACINALQEHLGGLYDAVALLDGMSLFVIDSPGLRPLNARATTLAASVGHPPIRGNAVLLNADDLAAIDPEQSTLRSQS
jgi:hypothetical protein